MLKCKFLLKNSNELITSYFAVSAFFSLRTLREIHNLFHTKSAKFYANKTQRNNLNLKVVMGSVVLVEQRMEHSPKHL